ncbi:cytochrome c biogenesis CcdA family protein [Nitrincola alkalilacustris]|uniref:cytochrome c biogenesis CcdA family protein n=1 Tax=Nitrincola alkalilacustris TaxID=1571224 RepID=UPI00124DF80E|nr:cytochrome c biogenesis protein CcdA [Nitrincola alkalilacustris]
MEFSSASYPLALVAGNLSILSPCVLPLLPILLASAASAHRRGPLALAAGLALSFTLTGTLLSSLAWGVAFDGLRYLAALLLLAFGVLLISSTLQQRFAMATAGLSGSGNQLLASVNVEGLRGQFVLGALLGLVWSPCVGPTLGAAMLLASQGEQLYQVFMVMLMFGIGAAMPLIILGMLSREAMLRMKGKLLLAGQRGKRILGALMLLVGLLMLTGVDKTLEVWALDLLPDWYIQITTRF